MNVTNTTKKVYALFQDKSFWDYSHIEGELNRERGLINFCFYKGC